MPCTFTPLPDLPEVLLVEPRVFGDDRGWFAETYKLSEFAANAIPATMVQDNHSVSSTTGTLRGLHFQRAPQAQGKLVRCTAGAIIDVAVDIRPDSPTFGQWASAELTADNHAMLWVPAGFAHGFQTLVPDTAVLYKCTAEYSPSHEGCIRWDDPAIGIDWPIAAATLNDRDAAAPLLAEARL